MFPTIADLINYLLHTHLVLPVQTLGFFMALAFIIPYFVFQSEFKRKEADGLIQPLHEKILTGAPASIAEIMVNSLLGFIFGFKILGAIIKYKLFLNDPQKFLLSIQGSIIAGIICAIGFGYWAYADRKKTQLQEPVIIAKTVHPYQLMPRIVFTVAFWGFIGAKLFDTVEHLDSLWYNPIGTLFSVNGFTYYGGLIFGALAYLYIGYTRGMKLAVLADMGSPGMMLAYGIGRIGCQLSGDGDWGIINIHAKPIWLPDWAWSSKFPHNEINAGITIKDCVGNFCHELVRAVYPTSLYEAVLCIGLFGLMWAIRKYITTPGLMFYIYLILNGTERFLIETIRINARYSFLGVYLTQAQLICTAEIMGALAGIGFIIYRRIKTNSNLHIKIII